jgi:glycosyltransferase involved in cell wall biosynthesis
LLAIPSLREAFGLVAVEGLVSGTPIVASDCIGLREVLKDTPARMFETGNSNDLANAILKIMKISPKTDSLNFIPTAKERFDIKGSVRKLELLFENAEKNRNYQCDIYKS